MNELKLEVKMFPEAFRENLSELKFVIKATDSTGRPDDKTVIEQAFGSIPNRNYGAPDDFLAYRSEIETIRTTAYVITIKVWRCRKDITIDDFKLAIETISECCRFAIGAYSLRN